MAIFNRFKERTSPQTTSETQTIATFSRFESTKDVKKPEDYPPNLLNRLLGTIDAYLARFDTQGRHAPPPEVPKPTVATGSA